MHMYILILIRYEKENSLYSLSINPINKWIGKLCSKRSAIHQHAKSIAATK